MTQSEEATTDPLIDEVRSRRRALMASCGRRYGIECVKTLSTGKEREQALNGVQ